MKHAAWCSVCTRYSVRTKFKFCSWNSHDHRNHQTSLSRARDGTGRKKRNRRNDQKRMILHVPKWKTSRSFWLYIRQSAWRVGRNFCGYLILRFFPNRKNSQNIVPANNSNNKGSLTVRAREIQVIVGQCPDFQSWWPAKCVLWELGCLRDRLNFRAGKLMKEDRENEMRSTSNVTVLYFCVNTAAHARVLLSRAYVPTSSGCRCLWGMHRPTHVGGHARPAGLVVVWRLLADEKEDERWRTET